MDDTVLGPDAPDGIGDPHGWNTWDNYRYIHDRRMEEHPFVIEYRQLEWQLRGTPGGPVSSIKLEGRVDCEMSVCVYVVKTLETRYVRDGDLEVRGDRYSYNASRIGQHNILRYDNGHPDPHEFHRHQFDLATGLEIQRTILSRADLPTLGGFLTEVAQMVGFSGE